MVKREQKITLGAMRASGVRGLLIYCSDYKCAHRTLSADPWPDEVRLSDIEPLSSERCAASVVPMSGQTSIGRKPK